MAIADKARNLTLSDVGDYEAGKLATLLTVDTQMLSQNMLRMVIFCAFPILVVGYSIFLVYIIQWLTLVVPVMIVFIIAL